MNRGGIRPCGCGSIGAQALHESGCREACCRLRLLFPNLTRSDRDLDAHRRHAIHDYEQHCGARDKDRGIRWKLLDMEYALVVAGTSGVRSCQLNEPLAHILCRYNVRRVRPNAKCQLTMPCVENPGRMTTTVAELRFCTFPKRSSESNVRLNDGPP